MTFVVPWLCKRPREPDEPTDYLSWHAWAERKSKTHWQVRCPACGMLHVWRPRRRARRAVRSSVR